MKVVYVAGPFSAPTRSGVEANIKKATAYALSVARAGAMPLCPHANTSHPDFETLQPYEFWIEGTMELLRRSDAIIMVPGWQKSSGATAEHAEAKDVLGIPVHYSLPEFRIWMSSQNGGRND